MGKFAVALLLAALLLGGCRPLTGTPPSGAPTGALTVTLPAASSEVEVPFETIALDNGDVEISDTLANMWLRLLASSKELEGFERLVAPQTLADLQRVDFEQYAVIVLYRGLTSGDKHRTVIEHITRQANVLTVYAHLWEPSPKHTVDETYHSSYHLVMVDKQQLPGPQLELVLQAHMLMPARPTSVYTTEDQVDIPFETIVLDANGKSTTDTPTDTRLLLLVSLDQIEGIKRWVTAEALADLQQVDFEQYAVIALFRGWHGSTNYQTVIERITKQNGHLVVYAQFWEPNSTMASGAAETLPYHLVKVDKQQISDYSRELVLQARMLTPTPPPSFLAPLFR